MEVLNSHFGQKNENMGMNCQMTPLNRQNGQIEN
jgi:hypothetical protein